MMEFYKRTNRFTRISRHEWIIDKLELDPEFLFAAVKSVLIHPVDAGKAKVAYDRKHNGIFHCQNSTVDRILSYDRLQRFLTKEQLPLETTPNDRAVLSCDHHAVLHASFLRHLGVPARVRTGFASYIVPGLAVPHWITEVFDQNKQEWIIMDSERRIRNVNRDQFIFACDAWNQHMHHDRQFPGYSGFSGRQGLKYALLCDLNCLFRNELLSYEWRLKEHGRKKPLLARISHERLSSADQATIDEIAGLMTDPEENMPGLWERYATIVEEQDLSESGFGE